MWIPFGDATHRSGRFVLLPARWFFWALREQDDTREVAISFKQLLQERGSEV